MNKKATYRVISSSRQDGSLAATSEVSHDMFKWASMKFAGEMLKRKDVFEVVIKKNINSQIIE